MVGKSIVVARLWGSWPYYVDSQEAKRGQEVEWACKIPKTTLSCPLPPERPPQGLCPAVNQVLEALSWWGTFHNQTALETLVLEFSFCRDCVSTYQEPMKRLEPLAHFSGCDWQLFLVPVRCYSHGWTKLVYFPGEKCQPSLSGLQGLHAFALLNLLACLYVHLSSQFKLHLLVLNAVCSTWYLLMDQRLSFHSE